MPTYNFEGDVVFVTGGARGQGRAHALGFAEHGADVAVLDRPDPDIEAQYETGTVAELEETVRLVERAGGDGLAIKGDVREEAAVRRAINQTIETFGRIDVLINNAGLWDVTDLVAMDEPTWDAVVDTDLKGAWLCAKHVGKHMIDRSDGGRIVSTGSTASLVGTPGSGHYAAAKHGVVGLTRALALELAEHDVTVNAVCPTGVDTPLIGAMTDAVGPAAFERIAVASGIMNVLNRQLLPATAVTDAVLWLASDAAQYVTGAAIPVDAGMTAK